MINFRLLSYDGIVVQKTISKLVCRTPEGMITILPRHINLVTPLPKQTLLFDDQSYHIESGILQFIDNSCTIMISQQDHQKAAEKNLVDLIKKDK